MFILVIQ